MVDTWIKALYMVPYKKITKQLYKDCIISSWYKNACSQMRFNAISFPCYMKTIKLSKYVLKYNIWLN